MFLEIILHNCLYCEKVTQHIQVIYIELCNKNIALQENCYCVLQLSNANVDPYSSWAM